MQREITNLKLFYGSLESSYPHHGHQLWEIHCITGGTCIFTQDDQRYNLEPGHLVITPPHNRHSLRLQNKLWFFYSWFTCENELEEGLRELWEIQKNGHPLKYFDSQFRELVGIQEKLESSHSSTQTSGEYQFLSFLYGLFHVRNYPRVKEDSLTKVLTHIHNNLDKPVGILELAEHGHVQPQTLRRLFKKQFGISPIHYQLRTRILGSQIYLETSSLSLSEIAERFGFVDQFHYSKQFKIITGVSPGVYRRSRKISRIP